MTQGNVADEMHLVRGIHVVDIARPAAPKRGIWDDLDVSLPVFKESPDEDSDFDGQLMMQCLALWYMLT